jgi:uncharacterized membrane protein YuzA (DUF378 family)
MSLQVNGDELTRWDKAAGFALALGALNWALVGLSNFDLIRAVFGRSILSRAAYGLVGAAGVYAVVRGRHLMED